MRELFNDFVQVVNSMNENDVRANIENAIVDTMNSYILDGMTEEYMGVYAKSSSQEVLPLRRTQVGFAYCSVRSSSSNRYFKVYDEEVKIA